MGIEFPITLTCTDGNMTSKNSHFTIEKSTDQGSNIVISLSQTVVMETLKNGSTIGKYTALYYLVSESLLKVF